MASKNLAALVLEELAGVRGGNDPSSVSISDAFVDGGESFLVFFVEDGGGIFEVEFLCLRHGFIVDVISGRCNENGCSSTSSLPLFRKERERIGHPTGSN